MDDYTKFYQTFLFDPLNGDGKNRTTTCPFCEKEDKFSINVITSTAQCLSASCGVELNHISFLTMLHEAWFECTSISNYKQLSEARGISIKTLKNAGLAYDSYQDRWYVPYKHPKTPYLTNLGYFYTRGKNAYKIFKAPNVKDEMPLTFYNPFQLSESTDTDTVYLTEGEWDTLAMMDLLQGREEITIGVPGALIFPEANRKWFDKITTFRLVFDNDDAGDMGVTKAGDILTRWRKTVEVVDWTSVEESERDKDVRDLVMTHDHETVITSIDSALIPYEVTKSDDDLSAGYVTSISEIEEVESYDQYIDMYSSHLHLSNENLKAIAITLAIGTSQYMHGEPLWFFLVGQPGCIDGDAEVTVNRKGKGFSIKLKDLHRMYHGGSRGGKFWDDPQETYLQYADYNHSVKAGRIKDVLYKGFKETLKIRTADGNSLIATPDHEFLTDSGWKRLDQIKIGDYVYTRGSQKSKPKKKRRDAIYKGMVYHPFASAKGAKSKWSGYNITHAKAVLEANANGIDLKQYLDICRKDRESANNLKFLEPELEIHHINNDSTDNRLINLVAITKEDHKKLHDHSLNVLFKTDTVKVVSIVPMGLREVYDVMMPEPHNFIANNFVVHNCGKTTLIESFGGNNEYYDYASRVTAKSLVSGWNQGPEASLITKMNNKAFFIKDFTVVLGMPKEQRKEVFNLFRDIYDGTLKITFGNGKVVDLSNLSFNMVAGVTDAIKAQNDASMGERFLRCDYMGEHCDDEEIIESALSGFGRYNERKQKLTEATLGYAKTILKPENRWDLENIPRLSQSSRQRIATLARYTAYIRTRPETDRTEGLIYKPRKEVATRLALQFAKLAFGLEKVFSPGMKGSGGTIDLSDHTLNLVAKVAHDTADGFPQDVIKLIHQRPNIGRKDLEVKLKLTPTRIHRVITDLKTLGLIRTKTLSNVRPTRKGYGQGRPSETYNIHPDFLPLMDDVFNG